MGGGAWSRWRTPIVTWAGLTAAVVVIQHVSNRVLREPGYSWGMLRHAGTALDGLVQYDGHRYLSIAADGYSYTAGEQSPIAWFPLYPLAIRFLDRIIGDPIVAAVVVTSFSSLIFLCGYWAWLERHVEAPQRTATFLLLAVSPYAFFLYGAVYADALFLATLIASIMLAESGRAVLAGAVGAAATACRPTGVVLVPVLLAITWCRDGVLMPGLMPARSGWWGRTLAWVARWLAVPPSVDRSKLRAASFAPLLSLAGVGAYSVYLWVRFDAPFAFATNQSTFHGNAPFLKLTFFSRVVGAWETPVLSATLILQAALTLAALLSVGAVARRFGFPYAVLVLGSVAIVLGVTHDFNGAGRYLLAAFPSFAVAGEWLAGRPRGRIVLAVSGALMLVMAFGFARGRYLG